MEDSPIAAVDYPGEGEEDNPAVEEEEEEEGTPAAD